MTTFHLVRHAEKDADDQVLAGRTSGVHLTERGRRQAAALGRRLAGEPVCAVYASPMERAQETAEPIGAALRLPVQLLPALTEIEFGEWTGRTFGTLNADARWRRFNAFRSGTRIPGGESAVEVQARVVGELLRLRAMHPDEAVVLVSHGDPIRLALGFFLGLSLDLFDRLLVDLASVSVLALDEHGAQFRRLNETMEV